MRSDALVFANARRLTPRRSINRKNCARLSGLVAIFLRGYRAMEIIACAEAAVGTTRTDCPHRARARPCAGIPRSRYRRNSRFPYAGTARHGRRPRGSGRTRSPGVAGSSYRARSGSVGAASRPSARSLANTTPNFRVLRCACFLRAVESCLRAHSPDSSPAARLAAVAFIHCFRWPLPAQSQTVALASHLAGKVEMREGR